MDEIKRNLPSLRALVEWATTAPDCPEEAKPVLLLLRMIQLDEELERQIREDHTNDRNVRYIYALVDPRDDRIYYVGQSSYPRERIGNHMSSGGYGNTLKDVWIKSLKESGLRPIIRILEACGPSSCDQREKHWIRTCLIAGEPLTNNLK